MLGEVAFLAPPSTVLSAAGADSPPESFVSPLHSPCALAAVLFGVFHSVCLAFERLLPSECVLWAQPPAPLPTPACSPATCGH